MTTRTCVHSFLSSWYFGFVGRERRMDFLKKQRRRHEELLKKQQKNLTIFQERFSKFMKVKTEIMDICLPKQSADSLVLQVNEVHYDPEVDQTFKD
ncbi:hypothetical protein ACTXT7_002681 [Hymenolepis weldensis]